MEETQEAVKAQEPDFDFTISYNNELVLGMDIDDVLIVCAVLLAGVFGFLAGTVA
jgi:hypothetical protein